MCSTWSVSEASSPWPTWPRRSRSPNRPFAATSITGTSRAWSGGPTAGRCSWRITRLPALEERSSRQLEEKRLIARAAAARIRDGDAILLDGGTTTLEVARLLVGRPLQIVTNSLPIANLFASSRETDLVMLGGYVYPKTGVALGPLTVRMMEDIHVQQTILSVGGITAKGLFNSNLLLVETERQMMRCADEVVVVADHTKIGRQALAFLCELSAIDTLIVDRGLTAGAAAAARPGRRARDRGRAGTATTRRSFSHEHATLDRAAGRTAGARRR